MAIGALFGVASVISGLFKKKEGGTAVGNILRGIFQKKPGGTAVGNFLRGIFGKKKPAGSVGTQSQIADSVLNRNIASEFPEQSKTIATNEINNIVSSVDKSNKSKVAIAIDSLTSLLSQLQAGKAQLTESASIQNVDEVTAYLNSQIAQLQPYYGSVNIGGTDWQISGSAGSKPQTNLMTYLIYGALGYGVYKIIKK